MSTFLAILKLHQGSFKMNTFEKLLLKFVSLSLLHVSPENDVTCIDSKRSSASKR